MTTKLTAEQRVTKQHVWLMNEPKYCQYAGIFMLGNTTVTGKVPTACTDGVNTYYGEKFVNSLSDEHLRGLILHENLHKAFRHLVVWKDLYKQNPKIANMACDYVINLMIHDSDPEGREVGLPDGGCLDEKYRGMDAQTVFKLLQKDQDKKQKQGDGNGEGNGGSGQDSQEPEGFDSHDWEAASELSEQEQEEFGKEVDQALRQGALLAGKLGGNTSREVLETLTPVVNWREALREFINSTSSGKDMSTWRRPNRRWIDSGVYLPSSVSENMGKLVIAIDTSGSIDNNVLSQFLSEVMAICRAVEPESLELLYWDTQVAQHETYSKDNYDAIMQSTKPKGGGGTDVEPVPKYIRDKRINPECVVVLTDGCLGASWGVWDCPTLWGITEKNITSPIGVSVYVG
jgi:predicted metal-dependent peptidase